MTEWISMKDRLPEEDKQVLTYAIQSKNIHDDGFPYQTGVYIRGRWLTDHFCESSFIENVTHWMPLPEPPKELKDENEIATENATPQLCPPRGIPNCS